MRQLSRTLWILGEVGRALFDESVAPFLAFFGHIKQHGGITGELLAFFWERKLWWMIPMVFVLMLFGVLIMVTQGTALVPFVHTLF